MVWADGQTGYNSGGFTDLHASFSLAGSQFIGLFDTRGQFVDAVDLMPQAPDASSGSNPDGDPAVLGLLAATPRRSNNQLWAFPPARRSTDGALLLSFAGFPFVSHSVLAATNLIHPLWANLALVASDGLGNFAWTDTNGAVFGAQRFYRIAAP